MNFKPTILFIEHALYFSGIKRSYIHTFQLSANHHQAALRTICMYLGFIPLKYKACSTVLCFPYCS